MAKQTINIGTTANDGTGDPLRTAFDKVNDNFTELYNDDAGDVGSIIAGTGISVDQATGNVTVTNSEPNATHTGDVTGATALTIADGAVTAGKLDNDIRGVQYVGIDTGDYIEFTADTQMDFYVNGSNEMRLEADGDLHVDGDVIAASTTVSSDEKLKENIKPIFAPLETLEQIKGVDFNWKKDGSKSSGVIAQDIQKVMPHLVKEVKSLDSDDSHLTVNYDGLIGLLIESVKELKTEIETLKNK